MKRVLSGQIQHLTAFIDRIAERNVAREPLMQDIDAQTAASEVATERTEKQIQRTRKRRRRSMPETLADAIAEAQPEEGTNNG